MITHSFFQASLSNVIPMKLTISTAYIYISRCKWTLSFVFQQQEWDKETISACQGVWDKASYNCGQSVAHAYMEKRGWHKRKNSQAKRGTDHGGRNGITHPRKGWKWRLRGPYCGIYAQPKLPANAHSITFIFFLHATYQEYPTVFYLLSKYRSPSEGSKESIRLIKVFRINNKDADEHMNK